MAKRDFRLNITKEMQNIQQKTVEMNREKKLIWLDPKTLIDDEDNEFFYGDYRNDVNTLAKSIKRDGFNEIIFAYKVGEQYKIRAGHRRKYAAIKAGVELVPIVLENAPKTDYERVIGLLDANNNKRDDRPMILARTAAKYFELIQARRNEDEEYAKEVKGIPTKELVADKMGKSAGLVSKYASLMKLIPPLQEKADDENYSWSALCAASVLSNEKQKLVNRIIEQEVDAQGFGIIKREWLQELISNVKNDLITSIEDYKCITVIQKSGEIANAFSSGSGNEPVFEEHKEQNVKVSTSPKTKLPKKTLTPVENIRNSAYMLLTLLETSQLTEEEKKVVKPTLRSIQHEIEKYL